MHAIQTKPYGSWESPITADWIVTEAVRFTGIEVEGDEIYVSELRPQEKGRTALLRYQGGRFEELLPQPYNARSRVHEYGGGSFLASGGRIFFSNDADRQIYRIEGNIVQLTNEERTRFADGVYDAQRGLLYYVMEIHGEKISDPIVNCLAAVDAETGKVVRIAEGFDFYSSPRISPDGRYLAYYAWNLPNMPWDESELRVAELRADGTLGEDRTVAGGKGESVAQPSWGPDGSLYFISDRSGWWNLYREKEGRVEPLCPMEAEFAAPQWTFGDATYAFWRDGKRDKIVCVYSQKGFEKLGWIPLDGGKLHPIETPFCAIDTIAAKGDNLYLIGAAADFPSCLTELNLKTGQWKALKKSRETPIGPEWFSPPQPIEFPTEGNLTAHAFYYAPRNPRSQAPEGELPPLIVHVHGGPTSQASPAFNLAIQYWTSRGIAVVDVNYGGSSGFGREYRNRLNENWGVVDVDDSVQAALYCARHGLADPNRMAIEGGSAGGYTTLAALTFRDVFRVGASYFGISDLEGLANDFHKFESGYSQTLVGPYPAARELYFNRSPLNFVERIQRPIILLQGDEDAIVPPPQSEKMYESLLRRGIPTAYLLFKNEQHGFRQAQNIKRSIEATAYFYAKVLGFDLADDIEPVPIDNLPN